MAVKWQADESFFAKLSSAIEKDDIASFASCMQKTNCGAYRFGRFPVLSALYFCRARKILHKYEKQFLKINSWQPAKEPLYLSVTLKKVAGKCLRLYLNENISPSEALLLCGRINKLKKLFPLMPVSGAIKERLQEIYYIRYGLNIKYEGNSIILERRPVSYQTKKFIAVLCAAATLCAAVGVSIPFIVRQASPVIEDENGNLLVSKLSAIDFNSDNNYILRKDITFPEDFKIEEAKCNIDGNGKTIKFNGSEVAFVQFEGTLENAVISTAGKSAFIDSVEVTATIKNVTVNVDVNEKFNESFAFFAYNNCGSLENVNMNIVGTVNADESEGEKKVSVEGGGIALINNYFIDTHKNAFGVTESITYYGVIKDCSVNYGGFTLQGVTAANCSFGGIAGANYGYIQGCASSGSVFADTVDIAGICSDNYLSVKTCKNSADITQTTSSNQWNPVSAGIALNNRNEISYCLNTGKIAVASTCGLPENDDDYLTLCAAGIAAKNSVYCNLKKTSIYALGTITNCINGGDISASASNKSVIIHAGGIAAEVHEGIFLVNSINEAYYGGSVTNCYFTGKITADGGYMGGIIGVMGQNVLENNEYYVNYKLHRNISGNYYTEDCGADAGVGSAVGYQEEYIPSAYLTESYGGASSKEARAAQREQIEGDATYAYIISVLNG